MTTTNRIGAQTAENVTLTGGTIDGVTIGGTTAAAGTFSSVTNTGNATVSGTENVVGNFSVATNKFTVAAASGNAVVAGTLAVTGASTLTGNVTASGTLSVAGTASLLAALLLQAPKTNTGATYTVLATDILLIANLAGTQTLTLPDPTAAANLGRVLIVKTIQAQTVVSASSNVVPSTSGTAGTAILAATAGKWAIMVADGTNWVIMAAN